MFRTYNFPTFIQDWPTGYVGQELGMTGHSVETSYAAPGAFARPWRFWSGSASNPPVSLEFLYLGTAADVTPHLLPDPHPWWTQSPGWTQPNGVPPTLSLWQDCLGTGNYNGFLYLAPLAHVANPPGTSLLGYVGGNFDFRWLDGIDNLWSGGPASFSGFHHWRTPPPGWTGLEFPLSEFDPWCRALGPPSFQLRSPEPTLPSTTDVFAAPSQLIDPIAIRFTTEHNQQGFFSAHRNLQSFIVLIDVQIQ